jgi:putative ABC transport system ATP-binding protein
MTPNTQNSLLIELDDVTKVYQMGDVEVRALRGLSFSMAEGEYVAIIGASGSGKSTLMNILGLLDRPTSGSYRIHGAEAGKLSKRRAADLRNREIGFVFQRFNLLPRISARRQVELPLFYAGVSPRESQQRAMQALERVGLGDRAAHHPDELSGGEQQRVAIARALVNRPSLLLADEPTGQLDTKTGANLLALFGQLHQEGLSLIVVTHDPKVSEQAERSISLSDGQIVDDRPTNGRVPGV